MKSPPLQFTDDEAHELVEAFIRGDAEAPVAAGSEARAEVDAPVVAAKKG